MSQLNVGKIGNLAGQVQDSLKGMAKAWANLNGTGTITLRDSFNVSSVVDNGTGDYTENFSNAFLSASYVGTTQGGVSGVVSGITRLISVAPASSRFEIGEGAGPKTDSSHVLSIYVGDLA